MLIGMIYENPGAPELRTRYRDPAALQAMGYEAIVIPGALVALPTAREGVEPATTARGPGRKPAELEAAIDAQVTAALAQNMRVFFYGDALLLPRPLVERHPEWLCEDGSGRLCAGKTAVYEAMQDQVDALFARWPGAAGLVMRTDVATEGVPHMVGTPLNAGIGGACPACRNLPLTERLARFIMRMHETAARRGKLYVHRAWQAGAQRGPSIHDDATAYRELSARLPASESLVFSFRHAGGGFRQMAALNACLQADDRPKWIELACESAGEGKGAFPNYRAPEWAELLAYLMAQGGSRGGAVGAAEELRQYGIWGWLRGGAWGGWGGPQIQREEWIDANVRALADLYREPASEPADVATRWVAETFGVPESSPPAPALAEMLMISARSIRKLLHVTALPDGGAGGGKMEPPMPFVHDDVIDVEALWLAARRAVEAGRGREALAEKDEAMAGVDRMRQDFEIALPDLPHKAQARDLANTLTYFGSFAGTVGNLFMGFVYFHLWAQGGRTDKDLAAKCKRRLEAAQGHWQQHTQWHAPLSGVASVFHENGLWERTEGCLAALEGVAG
jgi:hypothetical protein